MLGTLVKYNHTGHGTLVGLVVKLLPNGALNLIIFDDGTNALTDGLAMDRKNCVEYAHSPGPGQCGPL